MAEAADTRNKELRIEYDPRRRSCAAICALCGKRLYPLLPIASAQTASHRLSRYFNRCGGCGRWVCDGCFDVMSENGLCARCAEKSI